jgi:hypothetical protein
MSHFSVLVIGENPEKQLAPYQENNMGDCPKEYLKFEETDLEERRKEYKEETRQEFYCASHSSWGMEIPKEVFLTLAELPTNTELNVDINANPGDYFQKSKKYRGYYALEGHKRCEGDQWFEVLEILDTESVSRDYCSKGKIRIRKIDPPKKIPHSTVYRTFEDFMENWHGDKVDPETGKYGYWRNPNTKWDWYSLGGRWTGFFKLRANAGKFEVGCPGIMTPKASDGHADQALKKDIDFTAKAEVRATEAGIKYDAVMKYLGDLPVNKTWDEVVAAEGEDIDKAREIYNAQPRCKVAAENADIQKLIDYSSVDPFTVSREVYITRARNKSTVTFAVIKDGVWYERGSMGWWGVVSDEKDQDAWALQVNTLIRDLPEDTLLSVYDCHI